MKESEKIGEYRLIRQLGRGISASTWLASPEDPESGKPQAVLKVLDLTETSSWNMVDIFRREAEALKSLTHPGIPGYFDSFEAESESRLRLVLAMEYIEGQDLEKIVKSGRKFTEADVERILAELSDILAYLGSLRPPIVHRDVNPRNIILKKDASIALVDFSGVQDAVRTALFPGATLVGTAGYIPLEQVAGRATHRSDLYGAAATAVFLLTGRNPAELPTSGLKIDLNGVVDISAKLETVLSSWLDPDVSRRSLPASVASAILRGELEPQEGWRAPAKAPARDVSADTRRNANSYSPSDSALRPSGGTKRSDKPTYPESLPAESKVLIESSEDSLSLKIPRAGIRASSGQGFMFASIWIGFIAFWTLMTLRMKAPMMFPMFSIPFWVVGVFMTKTMLAPSFTKYDVLLTRDDLRLRTEFFGFERVSSWPLKDIGSIQVLPSRMQVNNISSKELRIEAGTKRLLLGSGLSERELLYLEKLLREEISRLRGTSAP
ncbi:MAG TPA: serine/threonine-protein kinase [Rectinemataceae bacterium]|nr:serine/threonine-protein kinase [Rectinemataceae bacterium]